MMMKHFVLGFSILSVVASAEGRFNTEPVSLLNPIKITQVSNNADVIRTRTARPYTNFLVAVPVKVSTGDACTKLVGQSNKGDEVIAIGSRSAVNDACIAVFPMPITAVFTVDMKVLTGGIVAPGRFHKKLVQFQGAGMHELELDLTHNTVTVKPVAPSPK